MKLPKGSYKLLYKLLGVSTLLVLWEFLTLFFPPIIIPPIEKVVHALGCLVSKEAFWLHLYHTVFRVLVASVLSFVIGISLGVLAGLNRSVYDLIMPVITIVENIPPIVWVVITIIWFGLGDAPPIFTIMSVEIPIVTVNVARGVQSIDRSLLEMAQSFNVGKLTQLRDLYIPAIASYVFSSISVGLGLAWRVVVMAEFFGSMSGVGYELNWARYNVETDVVFAYTLTIVFLGLGTEYLIINPLKEWALRWQKR